MNQPITSITWATLLFLGLPFASIAGITRIQITKVESPTFEGASFGAVGQYEKLVGRVYGEVDPADSRNSVITDLALAPQNSSGRIEYSADIYILRPIDRSKGNHRLFFEINNRGGNLSFGQMNDATSGGNDPAKAADAGNGFLMRQGYTIVWSGWDVTVAPGGGRFTIKVPVAMNADGSTITGPALEEFVIDDAVTLTAPLTYPAATSDKAQATLTVRTRYEDPPVAVPASGWDYANTSLTAVRLLPPGTTFQRGTLYEFIYPATNALIAGLGFAAIRDVAAFLHNASMDDQGNPNPLAQDVQNVYSFCVSQPCRTLHDFLWLGFNQDEAGNRVFDGMLNWIGGGSGIFMNYRFAQPGRTQRQHIARWYPEYQFPFANQTLFDPHTGKMDGRLLRCSESNTCPKIFEVNSENEYWSKAMSVFHLDSAGKDLSDPPKVRYYLMSSLPHSPGIGPTGPGICQQFRNPLVANTVLRALLVDLDNWVSKGTEPPASRLPRVSDGTLVPALPQSGVGFPNIPGVIYNGRIHTGDLLNFGPDFAQGILDVLPPLLIGTPYPALVPATDTDGNDVAGIRLPDIAVPLATYTGWGLRAFPAGANDGCDAAGQKLDFPKTKADRLAMGDPRQSIEERYPNHGAYVSAVTESANGLRQARLLLEEDQKAYVDSAVNSSVVSRTAAVAGPKDATVVSRQFQLDGTGSMSADGKPLTYQWTIPLGDPIAAILGGETATPSVQFGAQRAPYTFQLTVTDSLGKTSTDLVTINFVGN
ncbi:MAG TPA: alpha/beta hydrolase domain-containing protein [Bryobacteraceae bacterium]|nr:alpha/beta hydrolase domain-containing protein [Bryobacteraceae bacterium]